MRRCTPQPRSRPPPTAHHSPTPYLAVNGAKFVRDLYDKAGDTFGEAARPLARRPLLRLHSPSLALLP